MKRISLLLLALALVSAACGDSDDGAGATTTSTTTTTSAPTTTTPPDGNAELVLQITDEGGFVPVEYNLTRLPRYSVYSDGSLYYQGPVVAIYPGPLLPNIQVGRMTADDYADVIAQIERLGLPGIDEEINDNAGAGVADASTVIATYFDDAGTHRYGVYALGMGDMSDPKVEELSNLVLLLDQIAADVPTEAYEPTAFKVWVSNTPFIDPQLGVEEPWAFDFDPTSVTIESFGFGCTEIEGAAAAAALETFAAAHAQTFWVHEGSAWTVLPVPILPGAEGCTTA